MKFEPLIAKAYAHLFAAAPDLLAELKKQRCYQCRGLIGLAKPHGDPCSCDDARVAIDKAEGR